MTGLQGRPDELQRRRLMYGSNEIKHKPMKNFLLFIWEAWWDATMVTQRLFYTLRNDCVAIVTQSQTLLHAA
jgi:hypothetical protein